jgi:hypothetical protein
MGFNHLVDRSASSSLRFSRQFLVTPRTAELAGWRHHPVSSHNVYAHPKLSVTVHEASAGLTLVLLGFAIDPDHPEHDDRAVLAALGDAWERGEELPFLDRLSGRFALFAFLAEDIQIHIDATGTRTVEYMWTGDEFHAASQTYLLAEVVPLHETGRAEEFRASSYARSDREAFLPAGTTLYEGVERLVPNHRLSVVGRSQQRVWPRGPISRTSLADAGAFAADQLTAAIVAASQRFPLSLPVTAGYDSRTLLAAAPASLRGSLHVYTLLYRHLTRLSADVAIPARLARRLGLTHHRIVCREMPDRSWREIYSRNSPLAHYDDWGVIAGGLLAGHPGDRVALKGNASEIVRRYYWHGGEAPSLREPSDVLALQPGWTELPFAVASIEEWFETAAPVAAETGVPLDALFYWEHRCGSWQAQSQLEWDIAQEVFTPFGNRRMLARLLGVPSGDIGEDGTALLREIMAVADADVLRLPFNPSTPWFRTLDVLQRARHRVRRELRRLRSA